MGGNRMIRKRSLFKPIEFTEPLDGGVTEASFELGEDYLEIDTDRKYTDMEYYDMLPKVIREELKETHDGTLTAGRCFKELWTDGSIPELLRKIETYQRRKKCQT